MSSLSVDTAICASASSASSSDASESPRSGEDVARLRGRRFAGLPTGSMEATLACEPGTSALARKDQQLMT